MASILIIEDDSALRIALGEILTRAGHTVAEAANAADGIKQLRSMQADLVVTDLIIPSRNRAASNAALQREFPGIEIITLSAGPNSVGYLRLAAALDSRRTPTKPFMSRELVELLNEVFACTGAYSAHAAWRSSRHVVATAA